MTVQITIIGLGKIGTSIGLALAGETAQIRRVGHDKAPDISRKAQKLGAVDATFLNLHQSVENADVVILALPVDEIRETMELIAEDLKEGVVVLDTSTIKATTTAWATELFQGERFFVTFTPTINPAYLQDTHSGIEAAHSDLFNNSTIVITSPTGTDPAAMKLAADLASMLKATPLYSDPVEADGLFASVSLLPQLMAVALMNTAQDQPGWQDACRFAGPLFTQATEPVEHLDDTTHLGQAALLNKDNTIRLINDAIRALADLRDSVADGQAEEVTELMKHAKTGRESWLNRRMASDFETATPQIDMPSSADYFKGMFGLRGKKKEKK
jgi:prephenate dehydrogenase